MSAARLQTLLYLTALLAAGPACAGDLPAAEGATDGGAVRDRLGFSFAADPAPLFAGDSGRLLAPQFGDRSLDSTGARRHSLLSLDWQHLVTDSQALTVSAQYGDYGNGEADAPALGSARAAAVSWTALLGGDTRVIGQLFLGDESARDPGPRLLPRRYYGLLLEGRFALGREHAPFASLRWQRSDVDSTDAVSDWREQESRFAAGWAWQIRSDWDVRAEASYRFAEDLPELFETDRTRFGVSTRYGFR